MDIVGSVFYFNFIDSRAGVFNDVNLDDWDFSFFYFQEFSTNYPIIQCLEKSVCLNSFSVYIRNVDMMIEWIDYKYEWLSGSFMKISDEIFYRIDSIFGQTYYDQHNKLTGISALTNYSLWKRDKLTLNRTLLAKARKVDSVMLR